jgi:hypothetical protein
VLTGKWKTNEIQMKAKKMFVVAGIKIEIDDESGKYNPWLLLLPE